MIKITLEGKEEDYFSSIQVANPFVYNGYLYIKGCYVIDNVSNYFGLPLNGGDCVLFNESCRVQPVNIEMKIKIN